MTNPYTFTVMNPSEGYTLRINHHPDLDLIYVYGGGSNISTNI